MTKPQPTPVPWDEGFWRHARAGRLALQRCERCGRLQHYPRPVCLACRGDELGWTVASGRGSLYSHTVVRVPIHPSFRDEAPIHLADVELAEGVRILARLVGEGLDAAAIGAPVEVVVEPNEEGGVPVPCARLVRS